MLSLIALAVVALLTLLSACGESTADDFVGTWRRSDYESEWSPPLVITKTDAGYRGTFVYSNNQPHFDLERVGDTLKGQASSDRGSADVELILRGQSGRLTWRGEVYPDSPTVETEFVWVSRGTTVETTLPP